MRTDAERRTLNAEAMADNAARTLLSIDDLLAGLAAVAERYKDEPGFQQRIADLGLTERLARALAFSRPSPRAGAGNKDQP